MRRLLILTLLAPAVAAPAAAAQTPPADPAPEPRIAPGIAAGGIELGDLTVAEAAARLDGALGERLNRDVVVFAGVGRYRLTAREAGFAFDAERTARRALYEGRRRPAAPVRPGGGGAVAGTDVGLALSHSARAVDAFARDVQSRSQRAARNASLRITLRRMIIRRARVGRRIDAERLATALNAALADPNESRRLRARLLAVRPAINANDLRRRNGTILTADRSTFKLRLFKSLKLRKTYGIAVGQAGYGTPAGRFSIANKQVNPAWHVPNSAWAGSLAGQVIPGGAPNNPLKARWLGIADGVGIHGTGEPWSIGTRASHGCLRMKVPDVIDLYPRVPVGTPILIR